MSCSEGDDKRTTCGELTVLPTESSCHDSCPIEQRLPFCNTYTFKLGNDGTQFSVHLDILADRAPGLAQQTKVCNSLELDDCTTVDTFRVFLAWLYTDELHRIPDDLRQKAQGQTPADVRLVPGWTPSENKWLQGSEVYWLDEELVELYEFAQRYSIHRLLNATLDVLKRQNKTMERTISAEAVRRILKSTIKMPLLSQYIREEAELRVQRAGKIILENGNTLPKEYMNDFMRESFNTKSAAKQTLGDITDSCRYHVHEGTEDVALCARARREPNVPPKHTAFLFDLHRCLDKTGFVIVGPTETRFLVHKGLICHYGEYFRGAFQGGFAESMSGEIRLEEEDPDVFSLMLQWLYGQCLERPGMKNADIFATSLNKLLAYEEAAERARQDEMKAAKPNPSLEGKIKAFASIPRSDLTVVSSKMTQQLGTAAQIGQISMAAYKVAHQSAQENLNTTFQTNLVDLYVLADRRRIPTLKNVIMDEIISQRLDGWPLLTSSLPRISAAFESLPHRSGLCSYMVDEAAWCWNDKFQEFPHLDQLPSDFLAAVVQTMLNPSNEANRRNPQWKCDAVCKYHVDAWQRPMMFSSSKG